MLQYIHILPIDCGGVVLLNLDTNYENAKYSLEVPSSQRSVLPALGTITLVESSLAQWENSSEQDLLELCA